VYWQAVTYKTVIGYGLLAVALIAAGFYVVKPEFYQALFKKFETAVDTEIDAAGADQKHRQVRKP